MDYRIEQLRFQLREDPTSRVFARLGEALRRIGIDEPGKPFDFRPPELREAARQGVPLRWKLYAAAFATATFVLFQRRDITD